MKLKTILISLMLLISIGVQSQAMWILIFGDKLSNDFMQSGINFSIAKSNYTNLETPNNLYSWALGGFMDFNLKQSKWNISVDMTFKSPTGASNLNNYYSHYPIIDTGIVSENISFENTNFTLPIFLKYKTKYVNFGIGPQFSLLYKSTLKYDAITSDDYEISVKNDAKKHVNIFDVGVTGVVEFYLTPKKPKTSLRIGLRYYHGFLAPLKAYSSARNSVFMLSFGIPIVGKEEVKKIN